MRLRPVLSGSLLLVPGLALAHGSLLSQGEYRLEAGVVRARLVFATIEAATSIEGADVDADEDLSAAELETAETRAAIERNLVGKIHVTAGGARCDAAVEGMRLVEAGGVEIDATWRCPGGASEAQVELALLEDLDDGHRHLVSMLGTTSSDVAIAVAGNDTFAVSGTAGEERNPFGLMRYGVQHILEGWDHLLFLFALVLVGGRLAPLIGVVTAFTVGHSLSLAIGTLGWWVPPPSWVEPLIALSIAWVGVENFFAEDASKRWRITLPFGFIHGFGFAGVLREIGLARAEVPMALLTFNLGVEAGQIAVLAVLLPLVLWARKQAWFGSRGLHAVSGVVVAVGGSLFLARVAGWA